jgi:hypothetical protein
MIDGGDMAAGNPYHGAPFPAYSILKSASGKQSKTGLIYRLTKNRDHVFYETTGEQTRWNGKESDMPLA